MNLAVVGATGAVGETILRVLDERRVPLERLGAFASRDRDVPLRFRDHDVPVRAASSRALEGYDVIMFASSDDASAELAEACVERGSFVIDNSATFRMRDDVSLVVPEINPGTLDAKSRIFPVANCTAIVLAMGLAPIARTAGLAGVHAASYQAVSGAGKAGLDELAAGERAVHAREAEPAPRVFAAPIAQNVIPQIGSIDPSGDTGEERKIAAETRKILGLPALRIAATAVRVPVRTAHSVAAFVETERDASLAELAEAFERSPGIVFHAHGIVTPRDVEGTDEVHVARLRAEEGSRRRFSLWIVGDQLRKGAATNGVQILELLLARGLVARQPQAERSA